MLGRYDVEVEYLDKNGNVVDSSSKGFFDNYDDADTFAQTVTLTGSDEQVSIWYWDENEDVVLDSWIVKEYE